MEKTFECNYGEVNVRNIMIDIDDTNLDEGIEISGEEIDTIEVCGWRDIDDLTVSEVEELIEQEKLIEQEN